MAWPIAIDDVEIGKRFLRRWKTGRGKKRFQVREITALGNMTNFIPQLDTDSCRYIIVEGLNKGRKGQCTRRLLSTWAHEIL